MLEGRVAVSWLFLGNPSLPFQLSGYFYISGCPGCPANQFVVHCYVYDSYTTKLSTYNTYHYRTRARSTDTASQTRNIVFIPAFPMRRNNKPAPDSSDLDCYAAETQSPAAAAAAAATASKTQVETLYVHYLLLK